MEDFQFNYIASCKSDGKKVFIFQIRYSCVSQKLSRKSMIRKADNSLRSLNANYMTTSAQYSFQQQHGVVRKLHESGNGL